jgi:hypothetical protein
MLFTLKARVPNPGGFAMSMNAGEWLELLAMKRTSPSREKKVRTCLSLLAPFVCVVALVLSVYIVVKTLGFLPLLRLTQDRLPDHIVLRQLDRSENLGPGVFVDGRLPLAVN